MTLTHIIVIAVVLVMLVAMVKEVAHPATIAFVTLLVFFVLGYISPKEIMELASNEGVLTLVLLFAVASVIERTNVIEKILHTILDKSKSAKGALLKLMGPLLGFSLFLNNTPIVVMLIPAIQKWCREKGFHASKFLLPISYVTIFGGMLTIIGTSTNLIVHGWLLDRGFEGFSFFYLVPYAILGVVIGIIYLFFFGYKTLPEVNVNIDAKYDEGKKFLYEAVVHKGCSLVGKTVTSREIKRLNGVYLVKIEREGETITPVRLDDVIHENDLLVFSGTIESMKALDNIKHLSIKAGKKVTVESLQTEDTKLIEGVISHNSSLVNHRIKETNFRSKYDASIVAVHRKNERIEGNIGEIILRPGDVLLMVAGQNFADKAYQNDEFYILTDIPKKKTLNRKQTMLTVGGFVAMIGLVAFGFLSMFHAALLCVGVFLLFNLFESDQLKANMPFQVLILIVMSLGIGRVIETSGTAQLIADSIIGIVATTFGTIGLIAAVYLITSILTEVITNAASAIITLPIAIEVAAYADISPTILAAVVAISASASFATPIGYQTNLIVYAPGGYKFSDYLKLGIPLNIIFMVTVVLSVYLLA